MSRYISCETVFKLSNESFTVDVAGGVIEGKASKKQSVGESHSPLHSFIQIYSFSSRHIPKM